MVSSFDIFDTCLLRKCGTPENFFDVFSLRAFNGEVEEWVRQEFVAARHLAQQSVQSPSMKLRDIWDAFSWTHPQLKSKEELCQLEQETEREMLVPVLKMLDKVNECREKGRHIVFISDMYLPSSFLREVMQEYGFLQEGDRLYISCECEAEKWNGMLFEYIREKEKISFRHWHHYGDNKVSDYKVPKKLGIHCTLINYEYTPYQKQWKENIYAPTNRIAEILAGICRYLRYSLPESSHRDFLLDIGAPLFVTFTYRVLKKAHNDGIQRLYFCARDANLIYQTAKQMLDNFPGLSVHYLYISRESLYNGDAVARMKYFEQCGLASISDRCAIVDLRSSGKTQCFLNAQLTAHGYCSVKGYYFEMFCTGSLENVPSDYYTELNTLYYTQIKSCSNAFPRYALIESYFSIHNERRTINYVIRNGVSEPVCAEANTERMEDVTSMLNHSLRYDEHRKTFMAFTKVFMEMELFHSVDSVFEIAISTWISFNNSPEKYYLKALTDFYSMKPNSNVLLPYVKKLNIFELFRTRGRNTIWKEGSIVYSVPQFFFNRYQRIINGF